MNAFNNHIAEYLEYCEYRKRLNAKTLKAYRIDSKQYELFCSDTMDCTSKNTVDKFITDLHKQYKPKTVKRKIASLKAFFHYMKYQLHCCIRDIAVIELLFATGMQIFLRKQATTQTI